MVSLIPEDLHDGMTKTKFRIYMAPNNARFNSHDQTKNTMLTEFNQDLWLNLSHDIYMNRLGLQKTF